MKFWNKIEILQNFTIKEDKFCLPLVGKWAFFWASASHKNFNFQFFFLIFLKILRIKNSINVKNLMNFG